MVTFRLFALLAAATFVVGQTIDSFPPCAQTCYTSVKNEAGRFNCAADDMACLCKVQDFKNGVDDCTKTACPADVAPGFIVAVDALCATAAPAAPTSEPTTAPVVPVPVSSTVTAPPTETTPSATSTPVSSSTTETPAAVSSTSPTTSATPETTTTPAESTTASTSSTSSGAVAAKPSPSTTSSDSEAKTSSTPESDKSSEPAGLAAGAKAGIGIGAAAAVIVLLGVAFWAITQKRRSTRANGFSSKHMIKISDSSPGGGRGFGNDQHYETGLSELEMKSRRYEDMIPRQQPRHMV